MIEYLPAAAADELAVAQLHAKSWQIHYRGSLQDDYLDNHVEQDRLQVWSQRFAHPKDGQHIIVAKDDGQSFVNVSFGTSWERLRRRVRCILVLILPSCDDNFFASCGLNLRKEILNLRHQMLEEVINPKTTPYQM